MGRWALALALLVPLAACGGGGGAPPGPPAPPPPQALDGRYAFAILGGRSVGGSAVIAQSGQLVSDGQGGATIVASFTNFNSSLTDSLPDDATFNVDANGILSLVSSAGLEFRGPISDDGDLLALAAVTPNAVPGIMLGLRMSGTFSLGSLDGTYFVGLLIATQAPALTSRFGSVTFDGEGSSPSFGSQTTNANGTVLISVGGTDTGIYSVFADGSMSYAGALGTFQGGLLEGGGAGVLAGSVGGNPALMVLVKQGALALNNATFNGLYATARLHFTGATELNFAGFSGESVASGAGILTTASFEGLREGAFGIGLSRNASYSVDPSGRLTVTHVPGGTAEIFSGNGAILPGGRFGFCAGNNNPGDPPALEVYLRR